MDKEYTIKFDVGGETRTARWSGVDSMGALASWWHHIHDTAGRGYIDMRTSSGWLRVKPEAILYAEVLTNGR